MAWRHRIICLQAASIWYDVNTLNDGVADNGDDIRIASIAAVN